MFQNEGGRPQHRPRTLHPKTFLESAEFSADIMPQQPNCVSETQMS